MGVGRVERVLCVLVGVGEVGGRRTVGGEWRFYGGVGWMVWWRRPWSRALGLGLGLGLRRA